MEGRTPRPVVLFTAPSVTLNDVGFFAAPNYETAIHKNDITTEPNTITNHRITETSLACTPENNRDCQRLKHKYNWLNAVFHQ